jgi:heparan-alpha-glucosaminide N-acetyltransferase
MILVDDAGGTYARIDHSPWNGCTLADFVLPFLLFIVGITIAFALNVSKQITATTLCTSCYIVGELFQNLIIFGFTWLQRVPKIGAAVKKIVIRTLKMLFWGLLLQGSSFVMRLLL